MLKQGILISRDKALFILFMTLGLIAVFLRAVYMLPLASSLVWFVGVFVCFYVPGNLLQGLLKWKEKEYFAALAHSIALGVALVPVVYTIFRMLSLPWLLYPCLSMLFIAWLFIKFRDCKKAIASHTTAEELLAIIALGSAVFLLLHLSYFTDVIYSGNEMLLRQTNLNETIFHLGIINTLKDTYPPYFPYASGVSFGHYHLNMHLEIEMFNRLFQMDTIRLAYFYFPLLYFSLLVYLPYLFVRRCLGSRLVGAVTGLLVFGSDLSFIPGVLGMLPQEGPWNSLFNSTIWPLLTLNGFLPAMIVMFLCILHLREYFTEGKTEALLIFAVLGFAGYGFKSSLGLHIMAAACLTGSLQLLRDEKQKGKMVIIFSLISMLAMAVDIVAVRGGAGPNIVSFSLLDRFRKSLYMLGFQHPSGVFILLALPIAFIAICGIRIVGTPAVLEGFRKSSFNSTIVFLFFFVSTGYVLSELVFLGPIVPERIRTNNAMWFSFEALTAAWLFLSYGLVRLEKESDKFWQAISFVLILSLPGSAQFLSMRCIRNYEIVSSKALEVVSFLETVPPDAVILHSPNMKTASLSANLAGRQSVLCIYQSYAAHYSDMQELQQRYNDIDTFFSARKDVDIPAVLAKYGVTHVYAPSSYAQRFDREQMLQPVLKNAEYVVYRITKVYNEK